MSEIPDDFFLRSMVLTNRVVPESPSLINILLGKGFVKIALKRLSEREFIRDVAGLKHIMNFLAILTITEPSKKLVAESKLLAKFFAVFVD